MTIDEILDGAMDLVSQEMREDAREILQDVFSKGTSNHPRAADLIHLCALEVIGGRFKEGEKVLAADPEDAYLYAYSALHGRFVEGEEAIATDAQFAYYYARYVIKGRFREGEAAIKADPHWSKRYEASVLKSHERGLTDDYRQHG